MHKPFQPFNGVPWRFFSRVNQNTMHYKIFIIISPDKHLFFRPLLSPDSAENFSIYSSCFFISLKLWTFLSQTPEHLS